jgi:hypothetical protein
VSPPAIKDRPAFINNAFAFHHLRCRPKERQPLGTINAIVKVQVDAAEGYAVQDWRKGAEIMSSWVIIILAYVVIALGVFNPVGGFDLHPLFWN